MRNKYLQLEQRPIPADEGNYIRYSMRTHISPVEAAHLLSGIVPEADTELVFLNEILSNVVFLKKIAPSFFLANYATFS